MQAALATALDSIKQVSDAKKDLPETSNDLIANSVMALVQDFESTKDSIVSLWGASLNCYSKDKNGNAISNPDRGLTLNLYGNQYEHHGKAIELPIGVYRALVFVVKV